MHVCGDLHAYQDDLPDAGQGACCYGAATRGPNGCTCWEPVYDLDQQPLSPDDHFAARPTPCSDCAYRPDSPERNAASHVTGDPDLLDELVATRTPFWCHQGIRRVTALRHPPTETVHSVPDEFAVAYTPPMRDNRPYKADGTVADLCAGWALRVAACKADP